MSTNRSIALWQDAFIQVKSTLADQLTDEDIKTLMCLHRGERHGLHLEKLRHTHRHIYSIRTNRKRRLLIQLNGSTVFVLEVMENHKYERASALKSGVVEYIFDAPYQAVAETELHFDALQADHVLDHFDSDANAVKVGVKKAYAFNEKLYCFDEEQEQSYEIKTPAIAHGVPGSGKTSIAMAKLSDALISAKDSDDEPAYFVHYTASPGLAERSRLQFRLNNPELMKVIDEGRLLFLDTLGIIQHFGPPALREKHAVGFDDFVVFIQHQREADQAIAKKNASSFLKNESVFSNLATMYDEFQIISVEADEEKYLKLGQSESNYRDLSLRAWLHQKFKIYLDRLSRQQKFDPCLVQFTVDHQPIAFLQGDEMQVAPRNMMMLLPRLTKHKNVIYFCDTNQGNTRLSPMNVLRRSLVHAGKDPSLIEMKGSYRCPAHIVPLANEILLMRNQLNQGRSDRFHALTVKTKTPTASPSGSVQWVEVKQIHELVQTLHRDNTVYVIITHEAYVEEIKKIVGLTVPIYTQEEARGLEFKRVLAYRLLDMPFSCGHQAKKPIQMQVDECLARLLDESILKENLPKEGQGNLEHEAYFKALFIAVTRAQSHWIMIEQDHPRLGHLHGRLKRAIRQGQAILAGKQHDQGLAGTVEEWEALARENIALEKYDQALAIYRRLGKTEAAFQADVRLHHDNIRKRTTLPMKDLAQPMETQVKAPVITEEKKVNVSRDEIALKILEKSLSMLVVKDNSLTENEHASLCMLFVSSLKSKDWKRPMSDGRPFFVSFLEHPLNVRVLYKALIQARSEGTVSELMTCFAEQDFFLPYSEVDHGTTYTLFHWMMDDQLRSLMMRRMIHLMSEAKQSFYVPNEVAPLKLSMVPEVPHPRIKLPLYAIMAFKHLPMLGQLLRMNIAFLPALACGLLMPYTDDDGRLVSCLSLILKKNDMNDMRELLALYSFRDQALRILSQKHVELVPYPEDLLVDVKAWLDKIKYLGLLKTMAANSNTQMLAEIAHSPAFHSFLTTRDDQGVSIFRHLLLNEAFRGQLFFAILAKPALLAEVFEKQHHACPMLNATLLTAGHQQTLSMVLLDDVNGGDIFLALEGSSAADFYRSTFTVESLCALQYSGLLHADISILYFYAYYLPQKFMQHLELFSFEKVKPKYWLQPMQIKHSSSWSILGRLLYGMTYLLDAQFTLALSALLQLNDGALQKELISTGAGITRSFHGLIPDNSARIALLEFLLLHAKKEDALMSGCFLALIQGLTQVVDFQMLFTPTPITGNRYALLYCFVDHEALLTQLGERLKTLDDVEKSILSPLAVNAVFGEQSGNTLEKLSKTQWGCAFLCDFLSALPLSVRRLSVVDFSLQAGNDHTVFSRLMNYPDLFEQFLQAIAVNEPLSIYVKTVMKAESTPPSALSLLGLFSSAASQQESAALVNHFNVPQGKGSLD